MPLGRPQRHRRATAVKGPTRSCLGCVSETRTSAWRTYPPHKQGMGPQHELRQASAPPGPLRNGTGEAASAHGCGPGRRSGRKTSRRTEVQIGAAHPRPIAKRERDGEDAARGVQPNHERACSPRGLCMGPPQSSVADTRASPAIGTSSTGDPVGPTVRDGAREQPAGHAASDGALLEATKGVRPSHETERQRAR